MSNVSAIPNGMHTVTPHLVCAGAAEAIEFYKKAFNAIETSRLPGPNGRLMHASIRIGDSTVMLVDEMPEHGALGPQSLKGSPVTIHLYVDNVDAVDNEESRDHPDIYLCRQPRAPWPELWPTMRHYG